MVDPRSHEVLQWLVKALHDVASAECLLGVTPPLRDTAVYHCQQAAEKALKAYLTLNDIRFEKMHDLNVLIGQCRQVDEAFAQIVETGIILTPYATAFRYPGDVLEPTREDANEALRLAKMVVLFVQDKMPENLKNSIQS